MTKPLSEMRATNPKRAVRRGTEAKGIFAGRLKREGRWDEYITEREEVAKARRITTATAHNVIYDKYAPEGEAIQPNPETPPPIAPASKSTETDLDNPTLESYYEDKLPNGCPLFDEATWHGKANTNLLDDVQWVSAHLGLQGFDYVNRSPSLRACTLYWEARYTTIGMQRYQDLLRQLEVPDKATLKQLNNRKDDGAELNRLEAFMNNYATHTEENQ